MSAPCVLGHRPRMASASLTSSALNSYIAAISASSVGPGPRWPRLLRPGCRSVGPPGRAWSAASAHSVARGALADGEPTAVRMAEEPRTGHPRPRTDARLATHAHHRAVDSPGPHPYDAPMDTVVVGAGRAGLAVGRRLAQRGVERVVLERRMIGESWRSGRWDSFTLNTPSWMNRLPGESSSVTRGAARRLRPPGRVRGTP